jgi:hypothetical protein
VRQNAHDPCQLVVQSVASDVEEHDEQEPEIWVPRGFKSDLTAVKAVAATARKTGKFKTIETIDTGGLT